MNIELEYIKSLVKLASEHQLTELKVSSGEKQVVVKKEKETQVAHTVTAVPAIAPSTQVDSAITAEVVTPAEQEQKEVKAEPPKKGNPVLSPIVGTFYSAPSPDSPPFVQVGQKVEVGQVLCIIESMKLMNEIESELAGTVIEICVNNADPVEADQVIMYIE